MKNDINFDFSSTPGIKLEEKREYTKTDPIISVITPIYNGSDIFFQTVNSILNQTFPLFEYIIVDDGSKDKNTLEMLEKIEKMDERIKVYHKENSGTAGSKDFGVSKSSDSSKYILFIDSDDLIDKTYLETAYFALETNPDYSWAYTDSVGFGASKYLWQRYFNFNILKKENFLVSTALIRKKDFLEVDGFEIHEKAIYEDWYLWIKLLSKNKKPLHMNYYGFWYRRANDGELSKANNKNRKHAKKIIKNALSKMNTYVEAKQYPLYNYNWDGIVENLESINYPDYKKTNKKRILMCIPWMVMGGADKFNLDFLKLIDKDKYEVSIVITQPTEYKWRQLFEKNCVELFDLSTFIDHKYWNLFINYIIKTRKIDVFFNTNSTFGYASIPYIKATNPTMPIIDYIHMEEWYNRNGGYSRDSKMVNEFIDKTLFCNKSSEDIFHNYFNVSEEKIKTVYIGVDKDKFNPELYNKNELKKKMSLPNDKFIISYICRIDYQKRPFLLLKIIKNLSKIRNDFLVFVVGDGPLLKTMKSMAKKEKIGKYIKFYGASNHPEEIYSVSDVTINCSIKEGLALTAYESLSMNIPVISSDVGGQKELINDSVGVIVPLLQDETEIRNFIYNEDEIKLYTDGLIKILDNLDNYKNNCRKRILDGFTLDNMIENMQLVIDDVVENPNKNIIKNAENLNDFKSLSMELINFYWLANRGEYEYFINTYKNKYYGKISDEFKRNHQFIYKIKCFIDRFVHKFHLEKELEMSQSFCFYLLKSTIQFIKAIFRFIKGIILLIIYELQRFTNFISHKKK